jgi:hypothetical protein
MEIASFGSVALTRTFHQTSSRVGEGCGTIGRLGLTAGDSVLKSCTEAIRHDAIFPDDCSAIIEGACDKHFGDTNMYSTGKGDDDRGKKRKRCKDLCNSGNPTTDRKRICKAIADNTPNPDAWFWKCMTKVLDPLTCHAFCHHLYGPGTE